MNRYVLTALLCPVLGPLALNADAASDSPHPPATGMDLLGGFQSAPVDSPLVLDARTFVQNHLSSMNLEQVREAFTQIVAGINVKLICSVAEDDGPAVWQFVAFRSLDGRWHFYSANRV